jgi:hypothetical protein
VQQAGDRQAAAGTDHNADERDERYAEWGHRKSAAANRHSKHGWPDGTAVSTSGPSQPPHWAGARIAEVTRR